MRDSAPADVRFVEAANLRAQEAALTGESEPVEKQTDVLTVTMVALIGHQLDLQQSMRRRMPALEDEACRAVPLDEQPRFVGLADVIDPPRREARQAVVTSKAAGIHPVKITADHPLTALTIATELGIASGEQVLTGVDLNRTSPSSCTPWCGR